MFFAKTAVARPWLNFRLLAGGSQDFVVKDHATSAAKLLSAALGTDTSKECLLQVPTDSTSFGASVLGRGLPDPPHYCQTLNLNTAQSVLALTSFSSTFKPSSISRSSVFASLLLGLVFLESGQPLRHISYHFPTYFRYTREEKTSKCIPRKISRGSYHYILPTGRF